MTGVRFITITELCHKATAMVADAEKTRAQIVITKKGKPVALLTKVDKDSKGKSETVTKLKNNAIAMIEAIEAGKSFIITRNEKPVAELSKIADSDFRIAK
jgi:prevent-host-death family protein